MIKLVVIGANGRMGRNILEMASIDKDVLITGAIESESSNVLGQNVFNENFRTANDYSKLKVSKDLEVVLKECDVLIDFSMPESTISNLDLIVKHKKALVIGTTGFDDKQKRIINDASKNISCVLSPNMSLGVNIFFKLLHDAAVKLKDYDTEIIELHHNKKKDSPSGTALHASNIIARATNKTEKDFVYGRHGVSSLRKENEIGIHAVRAGDIVGEHMVMFTGNNERLEIIHRAHSRSNFVGGSIVAAKWLINRPSGLYDMWDVLDLKEKEK